MTRESDSGEGKSVVKVEVEEKEMAEDSFHSSDSLGQLCGTWMRLGGGAKCRVGKNITTCEFNRQSFPNSRTIWLGHIDFVSESLQNIYNAIADEFRVQRIRHFCTSPCLKLSRIRS